MSNRDDFSAAVKRVLANRVNWNCCNSNCGAPTQGPHTAKYKFVNLGVAAHITAAASGGPRYNAALTNEQRADINNGIWLCTPCSVLIDKDEAAYPVALLIRWKQQAETQAQVQIGKPLLRAESQLQQLLESNFRLVEQNGQLTEAVTRLTTLEIPAAPVATAPELRLAADVDRARAWSESGDSKKIVSAKVLICDVRADAEFGQISAAIHARVATVAAMCAFSTGDSETAREEVELALKLNPNNVICVSNAASVALMEDNFEGAVEFALRVRELAPDNENASFVLVQAWHCLGQKDKVEEYLRAHPSFFESSEGLSVLAHLRGRAGDHDEAIRLAKLAIKSERRNVQALEEFFDALFFPLRGKAWLEEGWEFGQGTRRRLKRAEATINRAIATLEKAPNKSRLHQALSNRASVRSARGKTAEALDDCDRILHSQPTLENSDTVKLNKALILIHAQRATEAVPLLESLQNEQRRDEGAFALGYGYHIAGQNDKALKIWEKIWNPKTGAITQMLTAELLLSVYRQQSNDEGVQSVLRRAQAAWPDNPDVTALVAQDKFDSGQVEAAIQLLRQAAEECKRQGDESCRMRIVLRLGDLCFRTERWQEAAQSWSEVGWARLLPPYRPAYLSALYHTGQLKQALQVAKQIRAETGFDLRAQEIEAVILAYNGNYKEACELWKELSRREPHSPLHAINRAHCAMQNGDEEIARESLQTVSFQSIANDALHLRRVSSMQSRLGFKDAIRFAFRARQIDFGNPESHNNYFQVFIDSTSGHSHDEDGVYSDTHAAGVLGLNSPKRGEVPCTVRLQPIDDKDEKQRVSITILKEGPFDHTHDVYGAHEAFARRLLDYARKDAGTFSIQQGPGATARQYRIVEVLSPYVHAFQESGRRSAEWFGEGARVWSFNIEQGLAPLSAVTEGRTQQFDALMSLYEAWHFPLCSVSSHFGRSTFDLWFLVASNPKWGVHAEVGVTKVFEGCIETLATHFDASRKKSRQDKGSEAKPILVLDSTSLLAIVHLGLDSLVIPHFRLFVPVSLYRLLQHQATQRHLPHIPADIFNRLVSWVDVHAEVLPVTSILDFAPNDITKWRTVLGQAELDALLLAREHEALLLSDDVLLRRIGESEPQIKVLGVNTQHILLFLRRSNRLSEEAYFEYLEKLAAGNVRHLLLPAKFLGWLLKKHDCVSNEVTRAAFRPLEAPMCSEQGAVAIVAFALADVALSSPENLDKALNLCLLPLVIGRPIKATLTLLQLAMKITQLAERRNERLLHNIVFAIGECKTMMAGNS